MIYRQVHTGFIAAERTAKVAVQSVHQGVETAVAKMPGFFSLFRGHRHMSVYHINNPIAAFRHVAEMMCDGDQDLLDDNLTAMIHIDFAPGEALNMDRAQRIHKRSRPVAVLFVNFLSHHLL